MEITRRKIRIATVGLGWVSTNRHIRAIRGRPDLELVGVVDRRPGRAAQVAAELNIAKQAESESLFGVSWMDDVDAVTIGAPPQAHYSLIEQALELGKHVLTEKPFVMTVQEGERLVALARRQQRTLTVVHNFQFARSFSTLRRDMERKRLGAICSIAAVQFSNPRRRLPQWYEQLPLGLFYDESPHLLYLLRNLVDGDLRLGSAALQQQASGARTPSVITAQFTAKCAGNILPVTLSINFTAAISEWYVMVHGEHGVGIVDLFRDIYLRLPNDEQHTSATVLRTSLVASWQHWRETISSGFKHLSGTLLYGNEGVFERFAQAARTGSDQAGVGPEDALAVTTLQHEIINSAVIVK